MAVAQLYRSRQLPEHATLYRALKVQILLFIEGDVVVLYSGTGSRFCFPALSGGAHRAGGLRGRKRSDDPSKPETRAQTARPRIRLGAAIL